MENEISQINESQNLQQTEKRKEKIKNWLKDKYNLIFVAILILAIIIRLYHFNLTKTQPLWWDEADYLAYAKNLAGFPVDWIVTAKHNSLYPYLVAGFFKFGLDESFAKLLLQIIPSILTVILTYFICNKMYKDKRIGLIASFLMATFWVNLFNSVRFHIDIPAFFIGSLAIYVFWQGYENKEKIFGKIDSKWTIPLTVFLAILTYTIRRGYFIFGAFFLIYILATRNIKELIKDKYNWIALGLALILLFLSEKFIFISRISDVSGAYFHEENPINLLPLDVFPAFFNSAAKWPSILLYLFWMGLFLIIINILLSWEHIRRLEKSIARSDLFNFITIITTLAFFIFVLRSPDNFGEPRWYLPLALGSFICISRISLILAGYAKPYIKNLSIFILIVIIGIGGYYEFKQADVIIKDKINSFQGIKDAGLFVKEVSNPGDEIIAIPRPQVAYYAERLVINPHIWIGWNGTKEESPFEPVLEKIREDANVRYLIISFSEPNHPDWMKKVQYMNAQQAVWEIPFMDTKIDFVNQKQDIKQEKKYGDIVFKLATVKQEVFVYEIIR